MSLCAYAAGLVIGAGGFVMLTQSDAAVPPPAPAEAPPLAYPQRPPHHFLPPAVLIDDSLPPPQLRREIVRTQLWLEALAAEARAAQRALRARPLELSVVPAPALARGMRVRVTLSYYYCEPGASGRRVGDGGGFCGAMRNGVRVHSGAAACAHRYLGQRFRIDGDPTGRIYTCEDTGSAVHGLHRDIWFRSPDGGRAWLAAVGQRAVIEIVP